MDLLIPSERNGGIPLLLSSTSTSAYLVVALVLLLAPSYLRVSQLASLTVPATFNAVEMISLTNVARGAAGLKPLAAHDALTRAAQAKLADMFGKQYFAHESPDGVPPWTFVRQAGYVYRAAGENLAADFTRAEDAEAAFLASPTHRANILNPLYTDIGVAVGQDTLFGRPSVLVVEYFGSPRAAAPSTPVPPSSAGISRAASSGAPIGTTAPTNAPKRTTVIATLRVLGTNVEVPNYVKMKALAIALIASLVLPLLLLAARTGRIPFDVGARAALAIAVLLYAATIGVGPWAVADLTPAAAAVILP